jgi:peptidylprolyl isomerase
MTESKVGDKVKIHYTGKLSDGSVFDSSEGREPLEFTVGSQEIIPGLSNGVAGMEPGQTKTIEVAPEEGFGQRVEDRMQKVERSLLPEDVQVGSALQAQSQEGGEPFTVWVAELNEDNAVLDANHPLAGRDLTFEVKMVDVEE